MKACSYKFHKEVNRTSSVAKVKNQELILHSTRTFLRFNVWPFSLFYAFGRNFIAQQQSITQIMSMALKLEIAYGFDFLLPHFLFQKNSCSEKRNNGKNEIRTEYLSEGENTVKNSHRKHWKFASSSSNLLSALPTSFSLGEDHNVYKTRKK